MAKTKITTKKKADQATPEDVKHAAKTTAGTAEATATGALALAQKQVQNTADAVLSSAAELSDTARRFLMAGIGAFAVGQEEGTKLFSKVLKKGQTLDLSVPGRENLQALLGQLDGQIENLTEAVKGRAQDVQFVAGEVSGKVETQFQDAITAAMQRLGVPSRDEMAELTKAVDRLAKNVERLQRERVASKEVTAEHIGGGWYEVSLGDVVVDKVKGREAADEAIARIEAEQG
jgi:poly(hydroxyalkanoate) granule-associated protein